MDFVFRVVTYELNTNTKTKIGDFSTYMDALQCLLETPAWHSQIFCMDMRTRVIMFDYIYNRRNQTRKFYLQAPKYQEETKQILLDRGMAEDDIIFGRPPM